MIRPLRDWSALAAAMLAAGVDQDVVDEVQVAWDRDHPDVSVDNLVFTDMGRGHMLMVRSLTHGNFNWCHHHQRWESVSETQCGYLTWFRKGGDGRCSPWVNHATGSVIGPGRRVGKL